MDDCDPQNITEGERDDDALARMLITDVHARATHRATGLFLKLVTANFIATFIASKMGAVSVFAAFLVVGPPVIAAALSFWSARRLSQARAQFDAQPVWQKHRLNLILRRAQEKRS